MNDSERDLRKPISYCCEQMEAELSSHRRDILDYRWHTRDYIIRSSTAPQVFTYVDFCPFCGKYIGKYSVYEEYLAAYEKAKEADPTLPDIDCDSELEGFREKFLRAWESQNLTLEKNQTLYYNQERLQEFLTNAKDDRLVVPRTQILNTLQTEKIVNAVINEAGLSSTEEALILLAIIFQKGGAARQCNGNLEAEVGGKKLRLKTVRDCIKDVGLAGMEWRLARSLATPIYEVCSSLNIPGNLAHAIINNETNTLTNVTDKDKAWMSDFQNDNENCPKRIRQLINIHFKNKNQSQN